MHTFHHCHCSSVLWERVLDIVMNGNSEVEVLRGLLDKLVLVDRHGRVKRALSQMMYGGSSLPYLNSS